MTYEFESLYKKLKPSFYLKFDWKYLKIQFECLTFILKKAHKKIGIQINS